MYRPDELIRRLRPLIGQKADKLWAAYLSSDPEEKRLLHQSIDQLHTRLVDDYKDEKIILSPPNRFEHLYGQYPIGMVYYADEPLYPFYLLERELIEHLLVCGRTGSGKTRFILNLLNTHRAFNKRYLIFDWKGTYSAGRVIRVSQFVFNPLDLTGIHSDNHASYLRQVIEIFMQSYFANLHLLTIVGVESLLLRILDQTSVSTFPQILQALKVFKGKAREYEWSATAVNVLKKILSGPLGKVLSGPTVDIDWLITQQIVFSFKDIGNSQDKTFLIRTLLLRLYHHLSHLPATKTLRLLIVLEEAHHILTKSPKESIIEVVLREIREWGVGIIIADQHPSLLSAPARAVYTTIALNLRLKADREALASALTLEQSHYLGRLPVQHCIIKLAGRYQLPFLLRINDIRDSRELVGGLRLIQSYSDGLRVIRPKRKEQEQDIISQKFVVTPMPNDILVGNGVIRQLRLYLRRTQISIEELILIHIYLKPLFGAVERYQELGLTAYLGNKIKDRLISHNLVKIESIIVGRGRKKLMTPTKSGCHWLGSRGFRVSGADGIEHHYWKRRLRDQFERCGYTVTLEAILKGKTAADMLVKNSKRSVAVEIETGTNPIESMIANIEKHSPTVSLILDEVKAEKVQKLADDFAVVQNETECITRVKELLEGI